MVIEGSAVMKRNRDRFFGSYGGDGTQRFPEKILAEVFKINRGGDIRIVEEVLRIKAIIGANFNQSEVVLLELLRRLVLIAVSFNTLKETMIGMSVKGLTKHNSKRVRELARYLITKWRRRVDEWSIASEAAAATKEVVTVSSASDVLLLIDEEERLKRNEDGFCGSDGGSDDTEAFPEENAEQNNKIIAEIFRINRGGDIMILEELLRIKEVIKANFDQSEVALLESLRRLQLMAVSVDTLKETQIGISVKGLTKHSSKRVRDIAMYLITEWRRRVDEWLIASEAATSALTSAVTKDVVKGSSASDVLIEEEEEERLKAKMEATKRKLKEGYQRAENAKKQRRARVMELKDLPNQGFCNCKSFGNNGLISV
ncbi:probable mediator of RNA polymerase II transcription subunit 26b [Telopea speciosissima]|uniref:probable mediator of RNA polymerase II transcription subunit 26b n=1 Tax=Telopea speciosissima TaxID=54955 RepID=UPI001CC70A80|nr:probable mediator of RNA polymerase II transcription subunit 26b [Telopea speciosissima]